MGDPFSIDVDAQGHIKLNDQPMELSALKEALVTVRTSEGTNASVVVKGAGDSDYQHVVSVLDVLQQADITKVGLATDSAQ